MALIREEKDNDKLDTLLLESFIRLDIMSLEFEEFSLKLDKLDESGDLGVDDIDELNRKREGLRIQQGIVEYNITKRKERMTKKDQEENFEEKFQSTLTQKQQVNFTKMVLDIEATSDGKEFLANMTLGKYLLVKGLLHSGYGDKELMEVLSGKFADNFVIPAWLKQFASALLSPLQLIYKQSKGALLREIPSGSLIHDILFRKFFVETYLLEILNIIFCSYAHEEHLPFISTAFKNLKNKSNSIYEDLMGVKQVPYVRALKVKNKSVIFDSTPGISPSTATRNYLKGGYLFATNLTYCFKDGKVTDQPVSAATASVGEEGKWVIAFNCETESDALDNAWETAKQGIINGELYEIKVSPRDERPDQVLFVYTPTTDNTEEIIYMLNYINKHILPLGGTLVGYRTSEETIESGRTASDETVYMYTADQAKALIKPIVPDVKKTETESSSHFTPVDGTFKKLVGLGGKAGSKEGKLAPVAASIKKLFGFGGKAASKEDKSEIAALNEQIKFLVAQTDKKTSIETYRAMLNDCKTKIAEIKDMPSFMLTSKQTDQLKSLKEREDKIEKIIDKEAKLDASIANLKLKLEEITSGTSRLRM